MNAPAQRPLRADAARNAERIVRAARAAFAESGTDVPLDEIARRAGVGVATLYRRFPTKEDLIRAIVEWRYTERVEPALASALADENPWRGMVHTIEAAIELVAEEHRTIKAARDPGLLTESLSSRFFPALATVVRRAQAAGQVRADLTEADLPPLVFMLASSLRVTVVVGQPWHRYLALLLDALRPGAASPLPGGEPGPVKSLPTAATGCHDE